MSYVCGIDVGGTFTDAVVFEDSRRWAAAKYDTDREALGTSVLGALGAAAAELGITRSVLLRATREIVLGSTIGTNLVVEGRQGPVALVTTRGFEDTLSIMRGGLGRTAGRRVEELADSRVLHKPPPLVARDRVFAITERVTAQGEVLVPLRDEEIAELATRLASLPIDAVAVCLLWSTRRPEHEQRVADQLRALLPGRFVTCSHDVSNRLGEFERWVATAVNAALGPPNHTLSTDLEHALRAEGAQVTPLYATCTGGVVQRDTAQRLPVTLLGSGPASGVAASLELSRRVGDDDVIVADMGGTTFDVGVIWRGAPLVAFEEVVGGQPFFLSHVDVTSIGAGGGSVAWIDETSGRALLKVGPRSAGARPGPVCYSRGGDEATVTDANLVLGYLGAHDIFGDDQVLDVDAARRALGGLGTRVGLDADAAAAAIVRIVDESSAELIRQLTVRRGLDPREFVLYAYGGGGPLHCGAIMRALGVRSVVIPTGSLASVWSAFGAATAEVVRIVEEPLGVRSPWVLKALNDALERLLDRAHAVRTTYDAGSEHATVSVTAALGYVGQVHAIELPLPDDVVAGGFDDDSAHALRDRFFGWYDDRYGRGFSYRARAVELRELRAHVGVNRSRRVLGADPTALLTSPPGPPATTAPASPPEATERAVWWPELDARVDTPVLSLDDAVERTTVTGPALVRLVGSTVAVHPGQELLAPGGETLTIRASGTSSTTGPSVP